MMKTLLKHDWPGEALEWIDANRRAFRMFCALAYYHSDYGRRRIGAKYIDEQLRWRMHIKRKTVLKINNNYITTLARQAVRRCPSLRAAFTFRSTDQNFNHG